MLTLREARREDERFLFALFADIRSGEFAGLQWTEEALRGLLRMQFDLQARSYAARYPQAERRIATEEGRPVGQIMTAAEEDAIVIVDLAVIRECRNRGIGGELVGRVIERARRTRSRVRLHVLRDSPAVRLYERLGFKAVGERYPYLEMEMTHAAARERPPHDATTQEGIR